MLRARVYMTMLMNFYPKAPQVYLLKQRVTPFIVLIFYRGFSVLCRLSIYSQSQSISINFNPFQSLSIPNLNGDWDWIVNPIFWGRLGLSQLQSFTFANRWFCPIYVSEIHKKSALSKQSNVRFVLLYLLYIFFFLSVTVGQKVLL